MKAILLGLEIAVALCLWWACTPKSRPPVPTPPTHTLGYPISIKPLVYEWELEVEKRGLIPLNDVTIVLTSQPNPLEEGDDGWCNMDTHQITLYVPKMAEESPSMQEEVVWHELGHCAYNLLHPADPKEDTIMQHNLVFWETGLTQYKEEYFARIKKALDAANHP